MNHIENVITSLEQFKNVKWILKPEYKDSRTKVIGKAIADCVTGENEFKDKKPNDIITFEGTKPEAYKQKHWNAVILYNYIHAVINGGNNSKQVAEVLGNKLSKLKACYESNGEAIDKAVEYIQDYADALALYAQLVRFRESKQKYDNENIQYIAPDVDAKGSNNNKLHFRYFFFQFDENTKNKRVLYSPTFEYADGQLYVSNVGINNECRDEGDQNWRKESDDYISSIKLCRKSPSCKWLLERLEGLVEGPDK